MLSQTMMTENPKGFLSGLLHLTYSNPLYNYTLMGRSPPRLLGTPPELLMGNAATGQAILAGLLPFQGRRYDFTSFKEALSLHFIIYFILFFKTINYRKI